MAKIPYIAMLYESVGANSTGVLSYTVPANEKFTIMEIYQQSTGTFRIQGIRDSRGVYYSNLDATEYAFGVMFTLITEPDIAINKFAVPLELPGSITFYIDVRDGTGAINEIRIFLSGVRDTGG